MPYFIDNFINNRNKTKLNDYQDLDHIDGMSVTVTSAKLYNSSRDDQVLFYFRKGANFASVYTKSKIVSENIKWNLKIKNKKIFGLLVNARNANAFTGKKGFLGLKEIADELANNLNSLQKKDEDRPEKIKINQILFGCTGTIGEAFPTFKIKSSIPELVQKIKYTQNKYIWMKAALGIMTTDLKPKLAMEECKIGNTNVKIYGIAKGSGMIYPNMATTLGYIFTDAELTNKILETTFNAITCDGDTSTNDMVSIFSTGKAKNQKIYSINDEKLKEFDNSLKSVLMNLAKRVASDGEGASKFVCINVNSCRSQEEAKKIGFSIANSPLVKTAIAGEDPNWGRIIMAIGKSYVNINLQKLSLRFDNFKIIEKGQLSSSYNEKEVSEYMKNHKIDIHIGVGTGRKNFSVFTMDLTKKYIEINSDYRS